MSIATASLIVSAFGIYFAIGFVFALAFISFGVQKIDPAAQTMPKRARLLILPGVMGLWPLMALKWLKQSEPPVL